MYQNCSPKTDSKTGAWHLIYGRIFKKSGSSCLWFDVCCTVTFRTGTLWWVLFLLERLRGSYQGAPYNNQNDDNYCKYSRTLPPPPPDQGKAFFLCRGRVRATGRIDEKTLLTLKVNSGLFKFYRFFYLLNSEGEFPGIELLRIVPRSGYNSPQDSVAWFS